MLVGEVERALDAESSDLLHHYHEAKRISGAVNQPSDELHQLRLRALEKAGAQIDFAILEATGRQPAGTQTATFNFYAPIGVVQAGAGSTVTVQQQIDSMGRDTILRALEVVQEALPAASGLATVDRAQLDEVIVEVRSELAKPEPNTLRVRGALTGIATTIQTLGAAAPAYVLLKGALALLGVHLP